MLLLAIETSGLAGSVALLRNEVVLGERSLTQPGRRHAQGLAHEMRLLLQDAGLTARDVEAVAVSRGPGSFTGLRVGLVAAKTFAYATGCRFVAVDTFLAIAHNSPAEVQTLWVVEDAQRGELFVGGYRREETGCWNEESPIQIVDGETWLRDRTGSECVTGPGLARHDTSAFAARVLNDPELVRPKAATIGKLGMAMLARHPESHEHTAIGCESGSATTFDFWRAVPFYIRPSAAEEQRAKRDEATHGQARAN